MSCPDCTKGSFLEGEPTGHFLPDGTYFVPSPSTLESTGSTNSMCRAVIFLMDAFGLPLKNNRILADEIGRRLGCDVYVPDIFAGRPLIGINDMKLREGAEYSLTIMDWLKMIWILIPHIPDFILSRPSVVDARLDKFFTSLKAENKYDKIGAVGYCFGGATAIRLGSKDWVDSIVICHPGNISDDHIKAIKIPASWVCAESDFTFPTKQRLRAEAEFASRTTNKVEYEFVDYKGTAHGFAIRPSLHIPKIKEAFERAVDQTVNWFEKTL
jgi:carboxymethylenebutenolidase